MQQSRKKNNGTSLQGPPCLTPTPCVVHTGPVTRHVGPHSLTLVRDLGCTHASDSLCTRRAILGSGIEPVLLQGAKGTWVIASARALGNRDRYSVWGYDT